jgi:hypothetical protein
VRADEERICSRQITVVDAQMKMIQHLPFLPVL